MKKGIHPEYQLATVTCSCGTTFRLDGREITSPLLGLHNVQNLLAALAACRGLGKLN